VHALVIEDQFLIATLIEDELADLGYTSCEIVGRKDDAIAAAVARCPDIITADDNLIDGSGIEAVKQICADQIIPVVFIVGNNQDIDPPVPFSVVIGKPFGGARLKEAIGDAIMLAEAHRADAAESAA
jgi:CheY-like chemotaxis protein